MRNRKRKKKVGKYKIEDQFREWITLEGQKNIIKPIVY